MYENIYIGSVASGKTTLAKELSKRFHIECTHLDGIVRIKDSSNKEWGNIRRSDEEIDKLFNCTIMKSHWLIEDAGRKIFSEGMEVADMIIYLKPSIHVRRIRIVKRFIKQKLGVEECLYTPSIKMLKFMFKTLNDYELGNDELEVRVNRYSNKVVRLSTNQDIKMFMENDIKLKGLIYLDKLKKLEA